MPFPRWQFKLWITLCEDVHDALLEHIKLIVEEP